MRNQSIPRTWRVLIALSALVFFAGASGAGIPPFGVLPEFPPVGADPDPGAIGSICIDFDELEDGTVVTNQFPEATFDSIPGQENVTLTVPDATTDPFICTRTIGEDVQNCVNPTAPRSSFNPSRWSSLTPAHNLGTSFLKVFQGAEP